MSGTQRRSMTGYGAATVETEAYRMTVEIKAVNQRFLEIAPRMPRAFARRSARGWRAGSSTFL